MSPETIEAFVVGIGLISALILGSFCVRFIVKLTEGHLQRLAEAESRKAEARNE